MNEADTIKDVVAEYEEAVFKSTKGLLEVFNKSSITDAISLLNQWLSITVADTSGEMAIGWEIAERQNDEKESGVSSFDPNFLKEKRYPLANNRNDDTIENNLWVRVAPQIKKLFERFLGEYYWGYGNILHYNDILQKYIHMCVDINIKDMRVDEEKCKTDDSYKQYTKMPIFPVDVIMKGIPLSQAFLGKESDIVFINWFRSDVEHSRWKLILQDNSATRAITNVNFTFPNIGKGPMPYMCGLEKFREANEHHLVHNLKDDRIADIKEKREKEHRYKFSDADIPFALAYTLSMFVIAAENYCGINRDNIRSSPQALGNLTVAFVPVGGHTSKAYQTALLVTIKTPQTLEEYNCVVDKLTEVSRIIARPLQILESQLVGRKKESQLLRAAYTRTAIASIMSRNGSHNIGSHVLAALSHSVGTMPDDRVLYQYIQHRMDYMATATTDFPTWRQPTMYLGTMMKTFLSQRHLLNHIAVSEGLKGWRFQDRNTPDGRAVTENKCRLKFRIYPQVKDEKGRLTRIAGGDGFVECINYKTGCMDNLLSDVSLAIPGGTVGQHAFFTIIENIIRNAAKHDWSSPPEIDEGGKAKGKSDNLEINIDFADIPEEGNVLFTISTNLSNAKEEENGKTLLERIREKLAKPFIDSSGTLRREDWGIAEMKISAGYLQGREPGVIGGIESESEKAKSDKDRFGNIITAVEVDGDHLGYRFKVPKARKLLLVTDKQVGLTDDAVESLARNGIYVKTKVEVESVSSDNSFEFVLVSERQKDIEDWLPSRVIEVGSIEDWLPVDAINPSERPIERILVSLINGTLSPDKVIDRVAAKYVKQLWKENVPLNLVVAPFHDGKGGGQSLVNVAAATAFVLEEGFKKAVESFKTLYLTDKAREGAEETEKALDFFMEKATSSSISGDLRQSDSENYVTLMKIQFKTWLKGSSRLDFPSIRKYIEDGEYLCHNHMFSHFCGYLAEVCRQTKGYLELYAEQISTLPMGFEHNATKENTFRPMPWEDANVMVCKDGNPDNAIYFAKEPTIGFVRHYNPDVDNNDISNYVSDPFSADISAFKYLEPLSGSQSYLVQMQALTPDDRPFQAKLIECALTHILIVDERVSKFAATHSADIRATFALMGISIADDKAVDDVLNGIEVKERVAGLYAFPVEVIQTLRADIAEVKDEQLLHERMMARKRLSEEFKQKFDVLIIHQGILDKWFHGLVDVRKQMSLLLVALREVFPKVVITTGRGTPANIPDKARVLPFSTIETTLFRKYPEKLILVDAIMNILPIRRG